jgi:Pyruvate phosphate dikinase, AMP/ATP-binding domain
MTTRAAFGLLIASALSVWGCETGSLPPLPGPGIGGDGGTVDNTDYSKVLSSLAINSEQHFDAFSTAGGSFGLVGSAMKFFVDSRDPNAPVVHYINGNFKALVPGDAVPKVPEYAKLHYNWAQRELLIPEPPFEYNEVTYFTNKKRYFAGTIHTYVVGPKKTKVYGIQFYPDDFAEEDTIVRAVELVLKSFRIAGATMAFVATGPQQSFVKVKSKLLSLGVTPYSIDEILGGLQFLPLNLGEAWGNLRLFPKDSRTLRPTDIVVFDELPLDLAVVAGTITRAYQDVTSHVNLKSKERGTPNMVLRDASATNPTLAPYIDKPVHLTQDEVDERQRKKNALPWLPVPQSTVSDLRTFDAMCNNIDAFCLATGAAFGGKSAGLGLLASPQFLGRAKTVGTYSARLGYDISPFGFALPISAYQRFLNANPSVQTALSALIADEKAARLSPLERNARALDVQNKFLAGVVPSDIAGEVRAQVASLSALVPAMTQMKFRSSANAEDIPNFDGAGLHDSFTVNLGAREPVDGVCEVVSDGAGPVTKLSIRPRSLECGIKGVYSSLWNPRAIEERSFARLDHASIGMGVGVVPAYDTASPVVANGVLITRVVGSELSGYLVNVQQGNNLVTNPEPGTIAQTTYAVFGTYDRAPRMVIARYATPAAGGAALKASVLTDVQLQKIVDIGRVVETAYCRNKPGYYMPLTQCGGVWLDSKKDKSLDMEFKLLENGQFVLKQLREFSGR